MNINTHMIHLPKQFRLFGQTWTIRMAEQLELPDDLGQCLVDQNMIVVNPNQAAQVMQHTIMHEVIHAIEQKLLLQLTEQQVDLIALAVCDIVLADKDFFDFIG